MTCIKNKKQKKTVGLALGSGGWRGLAHLGVIKSLVKNDIPINYIAGCSTGSVFGGLYDHIQDIEKFQEIVESLGWKDLISAIGDPRAHGGIVKGNRATKFFERFIGETKIEDLDIPFCAIATDLLNGKTLEIKKGRLADAIRASSSVPIIFGPVQNEGRFLVDGAVTMPVPTETVKNMGADIVIAVNLYTNIFPMKITKKKRRDITSPQVLRMSYQLGLAKLAEENAKCADIVIEPKIPEGNFSILTKFVNDKNTINIGEKAADMMIKDIKKLLY